MRVRIEPMSTPDIWRLPGNAPVKLRIYANRPFITGDGQFVPQGTPGQAHSFYLEVACQLTGENVLLIPEVEIDSTVDSIDNPWTTYTAELVAGGKRVPFLTNFAVNTLADGDESTTWGEIILLKNLVEPQAITESLTRQINGLITMSVGALNKASTTNTGVTALSFPPGDPTHPEAVASNDPAYLAMLGLRSDPFVNSINLMDEEFHASGLADTTTVTADVAGGGDEIQLDDIAGFAEDQGIFIEGAGPAGANYVGTVEEVNGSTVTVSPAISTAILAGARVQHDDTAAVNAAVAAALTAESAVINVPKGTYRINGPLQGSVGHQSCIPLQYQGAATAKSLRIQGEVNIGQLIGTAPGSGQQPSTDASLFVSEEAGGAIFGGEWVGGLAGGFSMLAVEFNRVVVRNGDNPTRHGIDGELMFALVVRDTVIDTGVYTTDCAQPTNIGVSGLIMPTVNNNFPDVVENVGISGYDRNFVPGEHTVVVGHLVLAAANSAIYFEDNQFHDIYMDRVLAFNCTRVLDFAGRAMVQIAALDIEHANSAGLGTPVWQDTVWDLNDPGNVARGQISWHVVKGGVGVSDAFTQNGGFYLRTPQIRNSSGADALVGGGSLLHPYVQLHNSVNQAVPSGTPTNVAFDTENVDLWGMHSTAVNQHRIMPTKTGLVSIDFAGEFEGNATGIRQLRLVKHRAIQNDDITLKIEQRNAAGAEPVRFGITALAVSIVPGDYFYIVAFQNSGVALNVTTQNFYSPLLNAVIH